jgi:hypothetical protein
VRSSITDVTGKVANNCISNFTIGNTFVQKRNASIADSGFSAVLSFN